MRAMNVSSNTIEKLKQVWNVWNLRGFILFSFSLQCILIVGSSLRIQTSRTWVHRFIWLVYLLADWAAYYAIGLVVPVDRLKSDSEYTSDIHAFWAPFLLLHIGGPNTIAGFSLEDNELWDRSVIHIVVQAGATGIAIYRALSKQELLAPTLLVFIAAFTRYVGRVLALSKGSLDDLRDSISSNERTNNEQGDGSVTIPIEGDHSSTSSSKRVEPVEMVAGSYKSFQEYKGIFCGLSIRTDEKVMENRKRLYALKAEEAFTEMEIQVSLAYDLFYTKIWTIIENKLGKILHIISLSSEVGALVLWAFANKHGYHKVDIQLTNTLLIGGIVVDVASTLKLTLSDLVIYHLSKCFPNSPILGCVLSAKKPDRGKLFVLLRRWSGSIKQFELMGCEEESISISNYMVKLLQRITGYEKGVSRVKLTRKVKEDIIKNIKIRALLLDSKNHDQKQRSIELGEYVLGYYDQTELLANAMRQICKRLGFVDALIVFHIATHFHYLERKLAEEERSVEEEEQLNIQISNYLMYLLYYQPKMMLEGAELDMTVEDMTTHLESIKEKIPINKEYVFIYQGNQSELDVERERILLEDQKLKIDNICKKAVKGEEITVELISASANYIMGILRGGLSEKILRDIWIDFLLYAAIHCKARTHVQQLGNGGQLLTIVWLMMAHLGLKIKLCD